MIPRVLHYCWFGGAELPDLVKECIQSWRHVMPDYDIKRWDESNWDVTSNDFAKTQWEKRRYAFVSDVCRLDVLSQEGGIYLDTDVLLKKPLDPFLRHENFLGMMFSDSVGTAVIGAKANSALILNLRSLYNKPPVSEMPNNDLVTGFLIQNHPEFVLGNHGQLLTDGTAIYPRHYFERFCSNSRKGYSQHLVSNSWRDGDSNQRPRLLKRIVGPTLWEVAGNLRMIPRAAHFRTWINHKVRLKRPRGRRSLIR